MNGVHDMGGMQGFGPINPEKNEPVFHAPWEGRVTAIYYALQSWRKWNRDFGRQIREFIPASLHMRQSYNQLRFTQVVDLVVASGMATRSEIESGTPARGTQKLMPSFTAAKVPAWLSASRIEKPNGDIAPKFQAGQRVRARNINPVTHTRLPRYARGKSGVIEKDHGNFAFPDSNARGMGEKPQHVYSVRFSARELWGEQAKPKDTVILAMWDDYLEAA